MLNTHFITVNLGMSSPTMINIIWLNVKLRQLTV